MACISYAHYSSTKNNNMVLVFKFRMTWGTKNLSLNHGITVIKIGLEGGKTITVPKGQTTMTAHPPTPCASMSATTAVDEGKMRRTASMDRRLCEAAQFAEAIGEAHVARDIEILDDDNDDDDETSSSPSVSTERGCGLESAASDSTIYQRGNHNHHEIPCNALPGHPFEGGLRPGQILQRHSRRKQWLSTKRGFLERLPADIASVRPEFVYKGVHVNPPEVVMRGIQRGNYAQLHRKAWLEVSDKYHRYGKNLRFYYRHWESLGYPTNVFFDWLDSKGESVGKPLPEIKECPREQLDSDTVLYITDPEVTAKYALTVVTDGNGRGQLLDMNNQPVVTGPDGWIFVLRDNRMYGAKKVTCQSRLSQTRKRFHHSSFFGGKAVASAGIFITDERGFMTRLYPHSGHYRPREAHIQCVLFFLHHRGIDLRTFDVDMQQILHVARDRDTFKVRINCPDYHPEKEQVAALKKKKVESLFLTPAILVACFLAHKARLIGTGFFGQIQCIQSLTFPKVQDILQLISDSESRV